MLTEAFINERCAVILGSTAVNPVYTFGLVCTGFGFFSFSLLRRLCKKKKSRKTAQIIIGVLCLGGGSGFAFCRSSGTLSDKLCRSPAADRPYRGCVYYNTAMYFAASRYMGRLIGTGMGVAILLQFVVQEFNTAVCHLYYQHYFECCVCHVFCHNSAEGLDSGKSFALFVGRQKISKKRCF